MACLISLTWSSHQGSMEQKRGASLPSPISDTLKLFFLTLAQSHYHLGFK